MTVTPQNPNTHEFNVESESKFDWKNCWYPVTFLQDFPSDRPYRFSIYDQPLVLFKDQKGQVICLNDLCSHRAAKLSDGQIIDGKIECLYHGWQFGSQGECLHIPQLPDNAKIPKTACIQAYQVVEYQGVIWVWLGEAEAANRAKIPTIDDLDQPGLFRVDTVAELPFDQTYLIENFLDPAHVSISHDRTEYNIKREDAQPLEMEIISTSVAGIEARYRRMNKPQMPWLNVKFIAPHLVLYYFGETVAFALYAVPLAPGRSRVLVRRLGNFYDRWFKLKPRWLEHLRQNKILEEDLEFIKAQEAYINKTGKTIKEAYLPLKTSDLFVMEHRKWLDKFGSELPHYQGYVTAKHHQSSTEVDLSNRFLRHTQICSSCHQAYQTTRQIKQIGIGVAIVLAALSLLLKNEFSILTVCFALFSVGIAIIAEKIKTHF